MKKSNSPIRKRPRGGKSLYETAEEREEEEEEEREREKERERQRQRERERDRERETDRQRHRGFKHMCVAFDRYFNVC